MYGTGVPADENGKISYLKVSAISSGIDQLTSIKRAIISYSIATLETTLRIYFRIRYFWYTICPIYYAHIGTFETVRYTAEIKWGKNVDTVVIIMFLNSLLLWKS